MRVLVACEYSGRVRDAFIARGHDAVSCDILPTEAPGPHITGDVRPVLRDPWDLVIAFPPCTHLAASGARWWPEKIADGRQQAAAEFFMACVNANAPRVAVENPSGAMSRLYRAPDQYVHPYMFGEPVRKRTGLWLRGLPYLAATNVVEPRRSHVDGDSGLIRGDVRGARDPHVRSLTFASIANAMAEQWG